MPTLDTRTPFEPNARPVARCVVNGQGRGL
jgi:hypothetical protein